MAHGLRHREYEVTKDMMTAGVLLLLYPYLDEWYTVLIKRTDNKHDKHKGQISFPGGKVDPSDQSIVHTALRECDEEIGVSKDDINILGQLTSLVIPVSNFLVHPVVGYTKYRPDFIPEVNEVAAIIESPISNFKNIDTPKTKSISISNRMTLKNVPYFDIDSHIVWGATAMILAEFSEIVFK